VDQRRGPGAGSRRRRKALTIAPGCRRSKAHRGKIGAGRHARGECRVRSSLPTACAQEAEEAFRERSFEVVAKAEEPMVDKRAPASYRIRLAAPVLAPISVGRFRAHAVVSAVQPRTVFTSGPPSTRRCSERRGCHGIEYFIR